MPDLSIFLQHTPDNSVPFRLLDGYPRFSADRDGATATEVYLIPSGKVSDFVEEMWPLPKLIEKGFTEGEAAWLVNGQVVTPAYLIPQPRYHLPGVQQFRVESIVLEPYGGKCGDPLGAYVGESRPDGTWADLYQATLQYKATHDEEAMDYKEPDTYCEKEVTVGGEYLGISPQNTKTSEAGNSVQPGTESTLHAAKPSYQPQDTLDRGGVIPKVIPTLEWTVRWRDVLSPPWKTIVAFLGTVNSNRMDLFNKAPQETVLFVGASLKRKWRWTGEYLVTQPLPELWDIEYRFSEKSVYEYDNYFNWAMVTGWNHVWSPAQNRWVKIYRGTGNDPLYAWQDHSRLFFAEIPNRAGP